MLDFRCVMWSFYFLMEKYIRGVFGKYVEKLNRMRIKYTTRMKLCSNEYQLNIEFNLSENWLRYW